MDPYKVLQVDPEAEDEVIQAAYRRLAQKYHPDIAGPDASTRMISINAAWELLRDPGRRAAHDRARRMAEQGRAGRTEAAPQAPHAPAPYATTQDRASPRSPEQPAGTVLGFGRYAGWSLGEISHRDIDYIEWLDRMPIGRPYRDEIDVLLRNAGRRRSTASEKRDQRGLFRRR